MFSAFRGKSKSTDHDAYKWTCGASTNIVHLKPLGAGGYGEVHEVLTTFSLDSNAMVNDIRWLSNVLQGF